MVVQTPYSLVTLGIPFDPMSEVNGTLQEAFLHHSWATRKLLQFCARLTPEPLSQPPQTPG
jgi:hypothetical protein